MADFHLDMGGNISEQAGQNTADSFMDTITSGGTDSFGAFSELIASTVATTNCILLAFKTDTAISEIAVNVAVGAAASEQVIVSSANTQIKATAGPVSYMCLPAAIPTGSRVSAQVACDSSSVLVGVGIHLFTTSFSGRVLPQQSAAFGMDAVEISEGTTTDPGGVANTKGAWAEMDASTSTKINGFWMCFGSADNAAHTDANHLVDMAIGGAGSELVIIENLPVRQSGQEVARPPIFFPISIPTGTRLAVRSQCSITDATDRLLTVSIQAGI